MLNFLDVTVSPEAYFFDRVKLGNFGHQVNSDIHLQTVGIQMRWLFMTGFRQPLEIMENMENHKKSSMHGKIMEFENP